MISFDFDETLDRFDVQDFAKQLKKAGHDLWIVTARVENDHWNRDLFEISDNLFIPRKQIIYTPNDWKYRFFRRKNGFWLHLDDDIREVDQINSNTETPAVWTDYPDWQDRCEEILRGRH